MVPLMVKAEETVVIDALNPAMVAVLEFAVNPLATVTASNVLVPANVCAVVFTTPFTVALASGKLNVCVEPLLTILKALPEPAAVPVANV